jgi:hypothetical protein
MLRRASTPTAAARGVRAAGMEAGDGAELAGTRVGDQAGVVAGRAGLMEQADPTAIGAEKAAAGAEQGAADAGTMDVDR